MRAAIYDPYLDTVGGGERYMMTVAYVLKKHGWDVEVFWPEPKIKEWLAERLGLNLSGIEIIENIDKGAGYDLTFWLSDGSIPTLWSKKNFIHFQTPFHGVGGKSLFNRLKLARIQKIVCNSKFTKKFIDKEYGVRSEVVYPPVSVSEFKPSKKENIILFVGRYSQLQQAKRQDVLVDAFKEGHDGGNLQNWRLVLIGGTDVGGEEYARKIKADAQGYPINVLENLPFSEVKKYYGKAKIFWSASGFGVDEASSPEKVEHFGISAVEAMAAGCVPLLYNAGGHKEIVTKDTGSLWSSVDELKKITIELVKDERRRKEIAEKAKRKARKFSQARFEREIIKLVS